MQTASYVILPVLENIESSTYLFLLECQVIGNTKVVLKFLKHHRTEICIYELANHENCLQKKKYRIAVATQYQLRVRTKEVKN